MMNQQQFYHRLEAILGRAKEQESHLKKEEIEEFFRDEPLREEQLEMICDYLLSKKIVVEGYTKTENTRETEPSLDPEDEKFLRQYRENAKSIRPCDSGERRALFQKASQGDPGAVQRLTELYLLHVAELAEELHVADVPVADLIQEGNLYLLLALREMPEKETDCHRWLMERVREGMEALITQQQDMHCRDRKMAKRVEELKETIADLKEMLGRKVYLDELADYMKIPEEEVEAVLKLAGQEVPRDE